MRDLLGGPTEMVGFQRVQHSRMASWGAPCNDRFDQRLQFCADERLRLLSGAYGRGGSVTESEEGIWSRLGHPLQVDAAWRVLDAGGAGLLIAPDSDDEAWLDATRHAPAEGDAA